MLRELVEKKHTVYAAKANDWQDAIRLACSPFVADGTVEPEYAEDVIRCIQKYGPYIVLFPGVAMPHSQEGGPHRMTGSSHPCARRTRNPAHSG